MAQTINISGVSSNIQRHLSIIGKRLYNKEGKNLFSNITVSTNETAIFTDYIDAAAQNIAAALAQFVTSYNNSTHQIIVENARWNSNVASAMQYACVSYATLFSVGEFLAMTHPELAEKYYRDAQGMMNTIITSAYHKNPPTT